MVSQTGDTWGELWTVQEHWFEKQWWNRTSSMVIANITVSLQWNLLLPALPCNNLSSGTREILSILRSILWPPCEIEAGRWQSVRKRVEQEESWPLSSAYPEKAHWAAGWKEVTGGPGGVAADTEGRSWEAREGGQGPAPEAVGRYITTSQGGRDLPLPPGWEESGPRSLLLVISRLWFCWFSKSWHFIVPCVPSYLWLCVGHCV